VNSPHFSDVICVDQTARYKHLKTFAGNLMSSLLALSNSLADTVEQAGSAVVAGAWLLTFADLLSRLGAVELPVGSVAALLGSPLFIWLLYRRSTGFIKF
jgi:ABC-type cobalamin transport system permease subunit